ncbi:MAG: hypothetical protein FWG68_03620 [Defluviitaleaceae bacterium]|nr:hypothetical protein [Defluviitaleaceae bacterium]
MGKRADIIPMSLTLQGNNGRPRTVDRPWSPVVLKNSERIISHKHQLNKKVHKYQQIG